MTEQELALSLTTTIILLIGISLYAIRLYLELWATKRSLSHIAIIQAQTPPDKPETTGCMSFLFGVILITALIGFVIISSLTS